MNVMYAGMTEGQWKTIHSLGIVSIILSVIGSTWIVYKTYQLHVNAKTVMPPIKYFPLLICIGDLTFGLMNIMDNITSIHTDYVATGAWCKFLGFGSVVGANYNACAVIATSIYIFNIIVREKTFDNKYFGFYLWKLHLVLFASSWGVGFIPFFYDGYGNAGAWCAARGQEGGIWVSYTLYQKEKMVQGQLSGKDKKNRKSERAIKRMNFFVLIYIVQWSPYFAYNSFVYATGIQNFEVTCLNVFVANFGGVFNAIAY
eukprot:Pgem_evm1s5383